MHKTKLRNGVLILFGIKNKQFAILGDAGINRVVPGNFWDETRALMESHFRNSEYAPGLAFGVKMAGEQLSQHFPYQSDDINEIPNEYIFRYQRIIVFTR